MISDFFPAGKLEAWLRADRKAPFEAWVTPEYKATRDKIFAKNSYRGPLTWYRSRFGMLLGVDEEANEGLDLKIKCPVMFMRSKETVLSWPEFDNRTGKFADDFEIVEVNGGCGHWVQLEAKDEVNEILENFMTRT
jgi:soluble epoxide hydrolase/lipid-phosphate phosphatase